MKPCKVGVVSLSSHRCRYSGSERMSPLPTVTQLMSPGQTDCKIFALSTAALSSQVRKGQVGTLPLPCAGAMCLWSLWRQKQWRPLRADLVTCHCQMQMLQSWERWCSVHQTLSLGLLFPPSPMTHPRALRTNRLSLCRRFLREP